MGRKPAMGAIEVQKYPLRDVYFSVKLSYQVISAGFSGQRMLREGGERLIPSP